MWRFPFRDALGKKRRRFPVDVSVGDSGDDGYQANAVHFDGSTALSIASLTAPGDNTGLFTCSMWLKVSQNNFDDGFVWWVCDPNGNYTILSGPEMGSNQWATGLDDLGAITSGAPLSAGTWMNLLISAQTDKAIGQKVMQIYINDALATYTPTDISAGAFLLTFNGREFWFAGDPFDQYAEGDAADIWIAPGQFIDFSVEANRRKFISANGKPVDLGADGSTPTGTAPAVFFSGNASGFAINKGTGGDFTLTGSLTNASTSPSD